MKHLITFIFSILLNFVAFGTTDRYRLMFNNDPSTEVTIGWQQLSGNTPEVYYGTVDHGTNWSQYSNSQGVHKMTNYMGMNNQFAKLTGLTPNTIYYFVIKDSQGTGSRYWFKTCPDQSTERLSFVSGGDSRSGQTQRRNSNIMVAKIRPHAVLFGGDLVDSPDPSSVQTWFDDWEFSYTSDGQIIPLVHSYGNHEEYGDGGPEFFSELFDCPFDMYFNVKFGGNLFSLYTLNGELLPGHTIPSASKRLAQTNWLASELPSDNSIWKAAQYHRPIVPHYSGKGEGADEFNDWANLFYDNGVRLVMESDAHVTKMTEEVRPAFSAASGSSSNWFTTSGIPQDKGMTFIGEGSWGTIRTPDDSHPMTTAMTSMYQFAWIVVDQCRIQVRTIDTQNPNAIPEHTISDLFSVSPALEGQVWKPSSLPSGIVEIVKCNAPVADFTASQTSVFTGQNITFTDLSSDNPTSWSWDFGDGSNSTQQNPVHSYATPGLYSVQLTATNSDGSGVEVKNDYIEVSAQIAPVAEFEVDDQTPSVSQQISFTDLSSNNPTSWSWDFGDGNSSIQQNPNHQYSGSGVYTVTLTASNSYGNDDEIKTNYITVSNGGVVNVPVVTGNDDAEEFTQGAIAGDLYLTSSDLELGNDLGDEQIVGLRFQNIGVPQGATISNAYLKFHADEDDLLSSQLNIYITAENVVNAAGYTAVSFNVSSRSYIASHITWADGTVPGWATDNYYDSPDITSLVQTIIDKQGWQSGNAMAFKIWSDVGESSERVADSYEGGYPVTLHFDWTLEDVPVASFSTNSNVYCAGETISFTDGSSNSPTSWLWNFGDGNSSTSQNPNHIYGTAGSYTVNLTATNAFGAGNTSMNIQVDNCTDISDDEAIEFSCFPNPSTDWVTLDRNDPEAYHNVVITDINGKEVFNKSTLENPLEIIVDQWAKGSYTISLKASDGRSKSIALVVQ